MDLSHKMQFCKTQKFLGSKHSTELLSFSNFFFSTDQVYNFHSLYLHST